MLMRNRRGPADSHDISPVQLRNLMRLLAEVRDQCDLTQRDLAMRIRTARNTVWRWETGGATPTALHFLVWLVHLDLTVAIVDQDGCIHHAPFGDPQDAETCARLIYARIAAVLREQRVRLGLSQKDLGARSTIRSWETAAGHPSLEDLLAWCREVGCKIVIAMPADHPAATGRRSAPTAYP